MTGYGTKRQFGDAPHQTAIDPKRLSALIVESVALASLADIDYSLAITPVSGAAPGQFVRQAKGVSLGP